MSSITDGSLYVSTHELELGLARRPCPYCLMPIMIRLPSMADAVRDQESAALRLGLNDLTRMERMIFDYVYRSYPQAVRTEAVCKMLDDLSPEGLKEHTYRMRKKLTPRGWLLITWMSSLRLIEPVAVIEAPPA